MKILKRAELQRQFRKWFQKTTAKPLLITGSPYSGKTIFSKQLALDSHLAAVHYCEGIYPESLEPATILRSITRQLIQRFPNLVIPNLAPLTLITLQNEAVEYLLAKPLQSLPQPKETYFLLIDGVTDSLYPLVCQFAKSFPSWLKLVVVSRNVEDDYQQEFADFDCIRMEDDKADLKRFIGERLPQLNVEQVLQAAQNSWFYVDQLARATDASFLAMPSTSHQLDSSVYTVASNTLPEGDRGLMLEIEPFLSPRLDLYLRIITSSRQPPTRTEFLAASELAVNGSVDTLEADLADLEVILDSLDPIILSGAWRERYKDDLEDGHALWVDIILNSGSDSAQTVIELAYHLAHCSEDRYPNAAKILRSFGADLLELRCAVFDYETTSLLTEAGAVIIDQSLQPDFVLSCTCGDLEKVRELSSSVDEQCLAFGLIAAASRGHGEVCRHIVNRSSYAAHYVDAQQWNALRSAACNNHLQVLELLIHNGINVDECGCAGRAALRAAAWSGHEEIVVRLLQSGADVNKKDSEGRTALMAASFMDHCRIVSILLEAGADPNLTDSTGATALHLCLANSSVTSAHIDTVTKLLEGGSDVNKSDANDRNCIHIAAYHGDNALELLLLYCNNIDAQDQSGRTALMLAACQGKMFACQKLIEHSADIDCIDNNGRTALILAALHANVDICKMFISLGADEVHKDNDGAIALHYAVVHPDPELCRCLCTPATTNITDSHGNHPLLVAAQNNSVEVVKILLENNAPVHLPSHDGQTALRIAAMALNEDVVRCIAEHIIKVDGTAGLEEQDLEGIPLLHSLIISRYLHMASVLLELGASTFLRDSYSRTCAHIVAQTNDVNMGILLRKAGCNFEARDEAGRTPLMTAIWASNYEIAQFMLETVGVSPNAVDYQGATALNIAAQIGHRELVVLLLKFGSEPSLCDSLGRNAADVAHFAGHDSITQILKSASGSSDSSGFGSLPTSPTGQCIKMATQRSGIATNPKLFGSARFHRTKVL